MPVIKLESADHQIIEVDVEVARASSTIQEMFELCDMGDEHEALHVAKVGYRILEKVFVWVAHHLHDPPRPEDNSDVKRADDISPWDADFLNVDQRTLYELIMAADYLHIEGLLDLTCKAFSNIVRGKTPEEIRQTLNMKNDYTPYKKE